MLVTGGAGFIGSNFIRHVLANHEPVEVVNLDKLTYAGNLDNLEEIATSSRFRDRYRFVHGDIADPDIVDSLLRDPVDVIVNFAAETHVDRSIEGPEPFLRSNYFGTYGLLEGVRKRAVPRFVQISTDEVYGSAVEGIRFDENATLRSSSPYAASKAAADLLALSYWRTFEVPVVIIRCSNNFGPYQFPEKLIPLTIANAMDGRSVPIYGDGLNLRDWVYVEDSCRAIWEVLQKGRMGEVYNAGGIAPRSNLEVVRAILDLLHKSQELITFVQDRPGHDRCYALDSDKLRREVGWVPQLPFEEGLQRTVSWYLRNERWLARCRDGSYREYYHRHYVERAQTLHATRAALT